MSAKAPKRIVLAAGGTAGHVVPALAVAEALRARGIEVIFIGGDRAEAQLVPEAGFAFHRIGVEGLSRRNPLRALRALGRAGGAFVRARSLLGEMAPDAVMGGGGYVAGPVGLAALSRRLPLVLTEADSHMGLANRILAVGAARVCLSFPIASRSGSRYRVTGRPVPAVSVDRQSARESFGIASEERCLLIFGGSLGARTINLAAIEAFGASETLHVLHVCGRRDFPELERIERSIRYDLLEYLDSERFTAALASADLVLARAGGSVFELAAHGLPAILVPYPHAAGDHQGANARWMELAGAAIVIADGELNPQRLTEEVGGLLSDPERMKAMASASSGLSRPQAAEEIADELIQAAQRRAPA